MFAVFQELFIDLEHTEPMYVDTRYIQEHYIYGYSLLQ